MALLFLDGFDKYGGANTISASVAALMTAGEWTSSSGSGHGITAALSSTGFAYYQSGGSSILTKTLGGNYSRLIGGFRFSSNLAATGGIQFNDAGSAQASLVINAAGTISIRNGIFTSGTVLGTSTAAVTANSTHYLEFDITFANAGSYQVWLDGSSVLSGSGDTTATANAFTNQFVIMVSGTTVFTVDDLYLFDSTGTTNNAVLLTSPRIETTFPVADSAVQFAFGAGVLGSSVARTSSAVSMGTASAFGLRRFTPAVACTLNSISATPATTNAATNVRPLVYADSAGTAGALLSSGATVTGIVSGVPLTMPLTTPLSLTAGTQYWLGVQMDQNQQMQISDALFAGYSRTGLTFASGAPNPAGTITSGVGSYNIWGNVTVTVNYDVINNQPPDGQYSYVFDSTVNHEDLYTFGALRFPPISIFTVAVKAYVSKSDSGAKTVSIRTKSGATDSGGSLTGQAPGTSFGWLGSFFPLNPNGNVAWTAATLNAATSGFKVDS